MASGHCLDAALHRHFEDRDRWLVDESPVETSPPSVLLTISDSSAVRGSPPTVRRNSTGAANSFMIISPLVSHLTFR
ncbi:hypothetical protein HAX54_012573, partial [Datura stramonium]|nr:hypothetical protein [Datura stramonium]